MPIKSSTHIIKGMMQDSSPSKASPEYAVDAQNIRITARENTSLLSVVNEKGNSKVPLKNKDGSEASTTGTYIGSAVLNQYFVLFTHVSDTVDNIYRLEKMKDSSNKEYFELVLLFTGNLNLSSSSPIETQSIFENADIQKVYWTDGINQPRMINIVASDSVRALWTDTSFDFTRKLKLQESVSISRNLVANGVFAPGVIQYAFTYYNKYAQESNIFYTSPQFYVSYNNRGAAADSSVSNSFDIEISNLDFNFDYVRVYSILRTSINATPECKRVIDLSLPTSQNTTVYSYSTSILQSSSAYISIYDGKFNDIQTSTTKQGTLKVVSTSAYIKYYPGDGTSQTLYDSFKVGDVIELTSTSAPSGDSTLYTYNIVVKRATSVTYTDTGLTGDSIDPTELLYVGGEEVIFGTMAQKDGTLFLGDITLKRKLLNQQTRDAVHGLFLNWNVQKILSLDSPSGYYPYNNQLKQNSIQIKTFKYLEYYRFGLQAQHYTGKWSEPIWVDDIQNTQPIYSVINGTSVGLPAAKTTLGSSLITLLQQQGYVKVRPVVVFPTINDREVLCQGILCPTVFNVKDRFENAPFAQSSWFTRPNAPFDLKRSYDLAGNGTNNADFNLLGDYGTISNVSRAGILQEGRYIVAHSFEGGPVTYIPLDVSNFGDWAEFRHNYPIPDNMSRHAEIQCISSPPSNPYTINTEDNLIGDYINANKQNYFVDQSILTFHSPDIEFDTEIRSIDSSNLKLRIVGAVPLTSSYGDVNVETSTPVMPYLGTSDLPMGFYKEKIGATNFFGEYQSLLGSTKQGAESNFGWRGMCAAPMWFDEVFNPSFTSNTGHKVTGFVVYPWHRSGSMNNQRNGTGDNKYKYSLLQKKQMSNIKFSYNSLYFSQSNIWNAYTPGSTTKTGISGISIFDSNEMTLTRLKAPLNSSLQDINYYGNVDKLLVGDYSGSASSGYPIAIGGTMQVDGTSIHKMFSAPKFLNLAQANSPDKNGTDPVVIKYKSTPHAVLALNYATDGSQRVLPTINDHSYYYGTGNGDAWNVNYTGGNFSTRTETHSEITGYDSGGEPTYEDVTTSYNVYAFWDKQHKTTSISQDVLTPEILGDSNEGTMQYGWLWLAELYNDNVKNRFGGQTEEAFENNIWLPAGETVSLYQDDGITSLQRVDVTWTEGDTYYQRYDHLKTYPYTFDDINQMTDIVSFMCETRVNIDGRYDRNRGQTTNFTVSPTNFNLLNNVYSQKNNFFVYNTVNPNKLNLDNFHNSITWTKTKSVGELIDTWTNITLASTLDLDGDKGKVRALKRFNNDIIAFQDRGISDILFNSRTQVSSTDGVPIEIANSGKVEGKRYIANNVGCSNKWSMTESQNGIYFADRETNSIYLFNGQLTSLTDKYGFRKWLGDQGPYFDNFKSFCDKNNSDVYFNVNNGDSTSQCLCFSEFLSQFTSFMDYKDANTMFNIDSDFYAWKNNSLWHNFDGDYNMFFGEFKPFSITVVDNADEALDKVFNNIDFRADSWDGTTPVNSTFDTLDVWDEYQHGTESLVNTKDKPSTLKRKFRIWRANIPRDNSNHRDRIRNTWAYIKLAQNNANKYKTELHDLNVQYFV